MHAPCHRQGARLGPGPPSSTQPGEERRPHRRERRCPGGAHRALCRADIAFPRFDERAVLRADRVRGTAALHGRFGRGHAVVGVAHARVDASDLRAQYGAMAREFAVFEHDRLMRLVEHRGELEVRAELTVYRGDGGREPCAARGVAPPADAIEHSHRTDARTAPLYTPYAVI